MAYILKEYKNTDVSVTSKYVCDTRTDIQSLPTNCSFGSVAMVIEDCSVWVLNSSKTWVELK